MDIGKIEYKLRAVTRYVVTRYQEDCAGTTGASSQMGEYENQEVAYEVAYALARAEHTKFGWPPGDMRMIYPAKSDGTILASNALNAAGVRNNYAALGNQAGRIA
jgi:hypothetical protein